MQLAMMTWPEVEDYLKKSKKIIVPIGSTEQHGPTGLIGTDHTTSIEIAKVIGEKTNTIVAPPICYGMALHHMGFPGSASLKPSTFVIMISEIIESFSRHGFQKFYFVNGHGGNIAPLTTAFCESLDDDQSLQIELFNWWKLDSIHKYEMQHFGEKNGFHATCGEVSVTMMLHPEAFRQKRELNYFDTITEFPWPMSPTDFRKNFPDGRMCSDPRLATENHGKKIFQLAVDEISAKILGG